MVARATESDLYRDKIEVSLDGRQIFYLFFGGAVVACLVFVLGVMVGRRLEARAHVDRAAATSSVRDPLAALDRLAEGKGELTFPSALGGSRGGSSGPVAAVDRALAAVEPAAAGKPAAAAPGQAPAGVEPAPPTEDDAPAVNAAADKAKAEKAAAEKAAADKARAEKVAAEKAAADKAKADKARQVAADDDGPASVPEPAAKPKKGRFTLQLSAFQSQAEADAFLATVKGAGYSAYVTSAEVDGKMFFRVRLGTYGSYEEAVEAKVEFEKKIPKIAYVTKL